MGPFISKPRSRQSEIDRIVGLQRGGYSGPPLHEGGWVRIRSREYSHIRCHTCDWGSTGPILHMTALDYDRVRDMHGDQWVLHRAECAVDEEVDI